MENPEREPREHSDPDDQTEPVAQPAEDDVEPDSEGPDGRAVEQARKQLNRLREEQ